MIIEWEGGREGAANFKGNYMHSNYVVEGAFNFPSSFEVYINLWFLFLQFFFQIQAPFVPIQK